VCNKLQVLAGLLAVENPVFYWCSRIVSSAIILAGLLAVENPVFYWCSRIVSSAIIADILLSASALKSWYFLCWNIFFEIKFRHRHI